MMDRPPAPAARVCPQCCHNAAETDERARRPGRAHCCAPPDEAALPVWPRQTGTSVRGPLVTVVQGQDATGDSPAPASCQRVRVLGHRPSRSAAFRRRGWNTGQYSVASLHLFCVLHSSLSEQCVSDLGPTLLALYDRVQLGFLDGRESDAQPWSRTESQLNGKVAVGNQARGMGRV